MIGNNLEKPRIFLKRFLVRETEAKDETLNQGGLYENEGMMNRTKMNAQKLCRKGGPPPSIDTANAPGLSNHNNFLLHSGHLSDNLKGDKLTVAVPKGYHNLVVYVVTSSSEVRKTFPLSVDTERELKNITHLGIKDTGGKTGWTMSREVYSLHVGEQHTVSRDCEWRPVSAYDVLAYM